MLILLEEINATMKQLARYWEKIRESGDPKASPAVDALNEILYMGRQLRMHVLLVAQSATARALGGPEVRRQFATRILARYSVNAWRMLAPEVHPAPKSTKHHGRAQVVIGGTARETQVLFFTETEAREWATTGKTAAGPKPAALPTQPGPVQLQKPPAPDTQPAAAPADFLTDAWSTTAATAAPDPARPPTATSSPTPGASSPRPPTRATTRPTPPRRRRRRTRPRSTTTRRWDSARRSRTTCRSSPASTRCAPPAPLASFISRDSDCRCVRESAGDQQSRGCRREVTALPGRLAVEARSEHVAAWLARCY
ncbi:hypothetical protein ACFRQM_51495 [Streptomyces sp. NPDC056831]|uniref:hypothetical protein n=1 Tax=Streptomyces sp. NPDC056831 TaxID=3345954 RepID=UPI0036B27B36